MAIDDESARLRDALLDHPIGILTAGETTTTTTATEAPASLPMEAPSAESRFLDRNAPFHQSRGHWGIQRLSEGTRLRRQSQFIYSRRSRDSSRRYVFSLWTDWFHSLAYRPTLELMAILFTSYTVLVFLFAYIYLGVSTLGAKITVSPDGSTKDSFCGMDITNHMEALYFSLSTMTTIGYGVSDYYFGDCWTPLLLVLLQSCCAITFQSVAIGLLFQRISRGQKRSKTIIFSDKAVIQKVRNEFYFMFQVGELRRQHLIDVSVRCYCMKHERFLSSQGNLQTFPFVTRQLPLHYPDDRIGSHILMSVPQVIVHHIDTSSPLLPKDMWYDRDSCSHSKEYRQRYHQDRQLEVIILIEGVDALTGQPLQARHSYRWDDIAWNHTFASCINSDIRPPEENSWSSWVRGRRCQRHETEPVCSIDFAHFHEIIAVDDSDECPYVF
jgi:Inward rectifier potassium channel C-terminal domain/Inward rectifier potassium channel transmembrane domain